MTRTRRALVYADVNLNILDGSAIWVKSMCEALSQAGVDTQVLLKAPVLTDRLVAPLRAMPGVTVVDPFVDGLVGNDDALSPAQAADILQTLDDRLRVDVIVVRGLRLAVTASSREQLHGRLWTYLTDIPHDVTGLTDSVVDQLALIAEASRYLLCQTEQLRSFLEAVIPAAAGRCVLWPPIVPEPDFEIVPRTPLFDESTGRPNRPIQLAYTGKYAARWNTLEMTEIPQLLSEHGINAELNMVGDKVHDEPDIPGWSDRMTAALRTTAGITWHGGVSRQEAMRLSAQADIGLSWRTADMDASLELSTKVLEFARLSVPVMLNRTPMHEDLFGADYPLFVADADDIVQILTNTTELSDTLTRATALAYRGVSAHLMNSAVHRLQELLRRALPDAPPSHAAFAAPLKVLVASHDLKFFSRLQEHLGALPSVELRIDHWPALAQHDEEVSKDLASWADVVICEWAGPNLVWYSKNKTPGQRLITRLHRFELSAGWLTDVEIANVDQVICVSPYYAQLTAQTTGWPIGKIVVIPNWVDLEQFQRPKLAGAQFTLGMIGISPVRKRPDIGIDVLSRLRRYDARFTMAVKSKMPWDYWWIWRKPEERIDTERLMGRLRDDPTVHDAVSFDGFGGDVAAWLRRVGWVLSTSEDESFHLAPAEGMASHAVPCLLPWPGADTIYHPRWISQTAQAMAEKILDITEAGTWQQTAEEAFKQVRASFPLTDVARMWTEVLTTDVDPATAQVPLYPTDE